VIGPARSALTFHRRTVEEIGAALIFALVPARLFLGPVGPFRAPGLEGEGLYGQLFAGAMVRRWLTGASAPGVADIAGDIPWWPAAPLGALMQALLPFDAPFALGAVVVLAVWLAGYGPWRLARRALPGAPVWGALIAGFAAQTSPVVLRAIPGLDLAALAVGPIALGLAHPRLALLGGLWSVPGALVFGVAGVLGRRPAWLVAALPALALLVPASRLPAALTPEPARAAVAPAYVTRVGATFPLPPEEQVAVRAAADLTQTGLWLAAEVTPQVYGNLFRGPPPSGGAMPTAGASGTPAGSPGATAPDPRAGPPDPSKPGLDGGPDAPSPSAYGRFLVPLQRVYGGPAAVLGLVALLILGAPRVRRVGSSVPTPVPARRLAAIGVATAVGATWAFGWQALPGELERNAAAAVRLVVGLDPEAAAGLPGGGALAWAAVVPAIGAVGLAALAGVRAAPVVVRAALLVVLAGMGVPLENPRLVAPVTSLPPDPIRETLATLDAGRTVVFPAPQWPYLQGQRPVAAVLWEAAATGQRVEAEGADPGAAALIGALTAQTTVPIDIQAARLLWESRPADPLRAARDAGWRYLLVDLDALPPLGRPRADGWLAERAGMPVARDGARLLYDLDAGPAGAAPTPGTMPPGGTPGFVPPSGAAPTPGSMPPGGTPGFVPPGGTQGGAPGFAPPPSGAPAPGAMPPGVPPA